MLLEVLIRALIIINFGLRRRSKYEAFHGFAVDGIRIEKLDEINAILQEVKTKIQEFQEQLSEREMSQKIKDLQESDYLKGFLKENKDKIYKLYNFLPKVESTTKYDENHKFQWHVCYVPENICRGVKTDDLDSILRKIDRTIDATQIAKTKLAEMEERKCIEKKSPNNSESMHNNTSASPLQFTEEDLTVDC